MDEKIKLSVLMPVYQNEKIGAVIGDIFDKVVKPFKEAKLGDVEVIVAEDGSRDDTRKILRSIEKKYGLILNLCDERRGYIKAAKEIYAQARGEYLFFTDSDGEHDPADFWKMWDKISDGNLDMVIGYKLHRKPFFRVFISKINNLLLGVLFNVWLKDANCGFRILKNKVAKEIIPLTGNLTIAYNAETPILAKSMGYRYAQVPVKHFYQESVVFSKKKLPKMLFKAFYELFELKLRGLPDK